MAWKVDWKVFIDGEDLTSAMRPFLISITITDKDGTASDACSLEFDDSGGQLKLPSGKASVKVFLQGVSAFAGTVDKVRSRGARGSGRTLSVEANGFDTKGKVKEAQSHHMDDASMQDFLDKSAKNAGLKGIVVDQVFAGIKRDYWSAAGESFLHIGQKIAREVGGTFKIRGDQAVLAKRGHGMSAAGQSLPTVVGVAPPPGEMTGNVINWSIVPLNGRGKFAKAKARYFDRASASFKEIEIETEVEGDAADVGTTVADEEQARGVAEGRKTESEREGGSGSVELDLEVLAQAEGTFVLTGSREGVDGAYRIAGVTHKATRSGGATTALELKQPSGGAGKDERKAGEGKSGSATAEKAGADGKSSSSAASSSAASKETYENYNRRYGTTDEN